MFRLIAAVILLLLMLFGGAVWLLDLEPQPLEPAAKHAKQKSAADRQAKLDDGGIASDLQEALAPPPKPGDGSNPAFDVARIDPNGISVFAGRAEPRSLVTILADGKELGTVEADENGEWTFTTEQKIANPDAKLALFRAPPGTPTGVANLPPAVRPAPVAPAKSASEVTSNMIKNLEGMVAEARDNQRTATAAAAAAAPPTVSANAAGGPASVASSPSAPPALPSAGGSISEARTSVPVPVTFVFNEATLTGDGRRAAALLLEYLQIKHFPHITLTGHADERGSDDLNMNLSRDRLATVARFLRENGFKGQLDLVPKGKTEPFSGVVRANFSQEDLYQLDRRVELLVSR